MTYGLLLLSALIGGVALGTFYFGGLWYTVERIHDVSHPAYLLAGSFLVRAVVVLSGFVGITYAFGSRLEIVGTCLLGFMMVRLVLVRRWGPVPRAARPSG
ncbi:ATP synthase subunit I [Longibacter salinarum]|uniref:ATP synthase subunit I n=1 Tax=Longibacter salinarum TaxID=1850348 RepID=A0A2A8D232_9BACT|nr:ATP synthase subunit I [Longibacter salinarum]PEN14867.1 ATP synthase subunit I [Longibacter salinarum]